MFFIHSSVWGDVDLKNDLTDPTPPKHTKNEAINTHCTLQKYALQNGKIPCVKNVGENEKMFAHH